LIDWYLFLRRRQFEVTAEGNVWKLAESHHLRAAASLLINELGGASEVGRRDHRSDSSREGK
jgi:hypothetical protein